MGKQTQPGMFQRGEDLPLFSGTAQTVREEAPAPSTGTQPGLGFHCPVCRDTGQVQLVPRGPRRYCVCEAAQELRRKDRKGA